MAVFLKELYQATKDLYHLHLLAGADDLDHTINWVYISEDITTSTFLNGGELIITTGVTSSEDKDWLKKIYYRINIAQNNRSYHKYRKIHLRRRYLRGNSATLS